MRSAVADGAKPPSADRLVGPALLVFGASLAPLGGGLGLVAGIAASHRRVVWIGLVSVPVVVIGVALFLRLGA